MGRGVISSPSCPPASIVLPTFEAAAGTMKVLIAARAIGFPIAVVLA
jgi:hypothetical protein